MNPSNSPDPLFLSLIPLFVQALILAGTLYALRQGRPKTIAEAHQAEASASANLVTGFQHLLEQYKAQIAELQTRLHDANQKAAIVPGLTRRVDGLEAELRRAKASAAPLPLQSGGRKRGART